MVIENTLRMEKSYRNTIGKLPIQNEFASWFGSIPNSICSGLKGRLTKTPLIRLVDHSPSHPHYLVFFICEVLTLATRL